MALPRVRFTIRRLMVVVAVVAGLLGFAVGDRQSNRGAAYQAVSWVFTSVLLGIPLVLMWLPPVASRRVFYLTCVMCLIMAASVTARPGGSAPRQRANAELCRWTFWMILTYGLGYAASKERHRRAGVGRVGESVTPELWKARTIAESSGLET